MSKVINFFKKYTVRRDITIIIFVIVYVAFSFATYKQYPIANGEEFRYLRGKETLAHFLYGGFTEKLIQPSPNYFLYNLYPTVLVFLNPKFFYEWFHLLNLLFSSLGFIAIYFLGLSIGMSRKMATLCIISLVLFPRFFGELAINPVDGPFMALYLLLLLLLLKFSAKNTSHWSTLLLGILFGICQGIRQLGLTLYPVMIVLDVYDFYSNRNEQNKSLLEFIKSRLLKYIYIFVIANFFMLITWPNFAVNFFKSYMWYLSVGSNFYLWDFGLLFFGKFLENAQRPWYYLPFFQFITYPIYITLLFLPTVIFLKRNLANRTYFILTVALAINYLLYFVLHPVVYDGIRHFLFLIPLITLLAFSNLSILLVVIKNHWIKWILIVGISLNLLILGVFTLREFPYQYFYFNRAAFMFGNPYKLFESDYSNTKYREAAEWLRDVYLKDESLYSHSDLDKMLKVYPCDNAYAVDYFSHKKFITVIHKEDAHLILCDYRNLKQSEYKFKVVREFFSNGYPILYLLSKDF